MGKFQSVQAAPKNQSIMRESEDNTPMTFTRTLSEARGSDQTEEQHERAIKGIPLRDFIDHVLRKDKEREENEGTLKEYPIKIPGFGLHAIQDKQKKKEAQALNAKKVDPKFRYQRRIAKKFLKGECRFKYHEQNLIDKMEDLLDDEAIREKVLQLEAEAKDNL